MSGSVRNPYLCNNAKLRSKFVARVPDEVLSPFVKSRPSAKEYVEIIQQSQVALGINRYPSFRYSFDFPDTYSRARGIEAPMMRACYLTEWTEGLEDLYDLEKDIATYRSVEEMREKINILQSDDSLRKRMRLCAQKHALSAHTFEKSL